MKPLCVLCGCLVRLGLCWGSASMGVAVAVCIQFQPGALQEDVSPLSCPQAYGMCFHTVASGDKGEASPLRDRVCIECLPCVLACHGCCWSVGLLQLHLLRSLLLCCAVVHLKCICMHSPVYCTGLIIMMQMLQQRE